jgi:hypothetical protein
MKKSNDCESLVSLPSASRAKKYSIRLAGRRCTHPSRGGPPLLRHCAVDVIWHPVRGQAGAAINLETAALTRKVICHSTGGP